MGKQKIKLPGKNFKKFYINIAYIITLTSLKYSYHTSNHNWIIGMYIQDIKKEMYR